MSSSLIIWPPGLHRQCHECISFLTKPSIPKQAWVLASGQAIDLFFMTWRCMDRTLIVGPNREGRQSGESCNERLLISEAILSLSPSVALCVYVEKASTRVDPYTGNSTLSTWLKTAFKSTSLHSGDNKHHTAEARCEGWNVFRGSQTLVSTLHKSQGGAVISGKKAHLLKPNKWTPPLQSIHLSITACDRNPTITRL